MAVLDEEKFWTNYSELREILPDLIEQFKKSYPENLKRIQTALAEKNADALRAAAHGLKGMLLQLYAPDSAALALQLEMLGKAKTLETVPELLGRLIAELLTLEVALCQLIEKDQAI